MSSESMESLTLPGHIQDKRDTEFIFIFLCPFQDCTFSRWHLPILIFQRIPNISTLIEDCLLAMLSVASHVVTGPQH